MSELALLADVAPPLRRGRFRVHRVVAPGRRLPEDAQRALLELIIRESTNSFGGQMRAYWEGRPRYFHEVEEWWVAEHDGAVAGWHGYRCWRRMHGGPVMYFDSLCVMPAFRRAAIGSLLTVEPYVRSGVALHGPPVLVLRTESPVVHNMLRRFVRRVLPDVHGDASEADAARARAIGCAVLERIQPGARLEPETFAVRGSLGFAGEPIYGEAVPSSGDAALDRFYDERLDARAGDACLCVGLATRAELGRAAAGLVALRALLGRRRRRR